MDAPAPETGSKDLKALASLYSSYVWNRLFGSSPSPRFRFPRENLRPVPPDRSPEVPQAHVPSSSSAAFQFSRPLRGFDRGI
ncbi:hypothetical protein NL676_031332 [Syzygium grande]|nr:hypothetical protein NL676_031332 [Syzygium grande]